MDRITGRAATILATAGIATAVLFAWLTAPPDVASTIAFYAAAAAALPALAVAGNWTGFAVRWLHWRFGRRAANA